MRLAWWEVLGSVTVMLAVVLVLAWWQEHPR